jgi:HPP family
VGGRPGGDMERSGETREGSAVVAVPVLLFVIDAVSRAVRGRGTEFLLVPPLAVVIYLLFSEPDRTDGRLRAVVLLPFIAALSGEVGYGLLGLTPWAIAGVVVVVLLTQWMLHARMPPALAIAILAMFLRVRSPWYPVDVVLSSTLVWIAFHGWRGLQRRAVG